MKTTLRKKIVREMKGQELIAKQQRDALLTQYLLKSSVYQHAKTIATYLSLPHEFDTRTFIRKAQADGKRVVIPKTYPHGHMVFVDYNPNDLELTAFGIWEPRSGQVVEKTHIDLIHVPGVAFNKDGYRIGYGGGYYDHYLADFKGMTASTVYPCQLADFQPDNYDIPVQEVLICE
ncbi:5-formyltetrahydrofolate cyclo-ligase [Streptococcus constellatus]|nr:5-formyltetrahydrofolate cyclo-ligase [Streptococcus constellatus]